MVRLNNQQRERAIGRLQAGERPADVARAFGCHRSTVTRLLGRFNATGTTGDTHRVGRPRVTTPRDDRQILRLHQGDRFTTAASTARRTIGTHGRPVSRHTIQRRLGDQQMRCRRPYRGAVLTHRHRQERVNWAQAHVNWRLVHWRNVLFTDESLFTGDTMNGRVRVYRRQGERFNDDCLLQRDRWGGARVMVWAGIAHNHVIGPVILENNGITAQRYVDEVLLPHVVPFFQQNGHFLLQQDNARAHTARVTQEFLQHHGIHLLPHPAQSPDLNPIEHYWDALQRRLDQVRPRPVTRQELQRAIRDEAGQIPIHFVNSLVASMYRRCRAVIQANGGHTSY